MWTEREDEGISTISEFSRETEEGKVVLRFSLPFFGLGEMVDATGDQKKKAVLLL